MMLNRREILRLAVTVPAASGLVPETSMATVPESDHVRIIDSNISLFQWPFRRLPLDTTPAIISRLKSLGVVQAWAGTFEGLLHRDLRAVNDRLAKECSAYSELIPIGSINPAATGWQNDLNRCIEQHQMPGIRLHPNYHGYALNDGRFEDLLQRCTNAGRFVQIAVAMEDNRTQNAIAEVADVNLAPLAQVVAGIPDARIQLLNARLRPAELNHVKHLSNVFFDTARVDGTDAISKLVDAVTRQRVLFGSHAPFLIAEAAMIRVHESSQLDVPSLMAVYGTNAQEFAGSGISS
jgi:predicted TIM-barrel fold metal-dependent hydrolase